MLCEQFGRQTDGPIGVVSDRAVDNLDFVHASLLHQADLRASISCGLPLPRPGKPLDVQFDQGNALSALAFRSRLNGGHQRMVAKQVAQ